MEQREGNRNEGRKGQGKGLESMASVSEQSRAEQCRMVEQAPRGGSGAERCGGLWTDRLETRPFTPCFGRLHAVISLSVGDPHGGQVGQVGQVKPAEICAIQSGSQNS